MNHSTMILTGGFLLIGILYGMAWWRGIAIGTAFRAFAVLWAILSVVNLWVGVAHAGYSLAEELPILIPIFGVPTAAAWLLARWIR